MNFATFFLEQYGAVAFCPCDYTKSPYKIKLIFQKYHTGMLLATATHNLNIMIRYLFKCVSKYFRVTVTVYFASFEK